MIVKYFLRPLHQLLGLGNTAFDMLKADGIDKAVTDALIYHEFHIQIGFAAKAAFPIKLVNRFLASDGAEDRDSAEFINMVVYGLHTDRTHICDKEAGVKGT